MQREELYLRDIVAAADAVADFVAGLTEDVFIGADVVCSAVMYKPIIIGEAASSLPTVFRASHPSVPWAEISAFRNKAVHHYFGTDWRVVWEVAIRDVPALRALVAGILAVEFSGWAGPAP